MTKSHASEVAGPTAAQMKEFWAQVGSGRISRESLQWFLNRSDFTSFIVEVYYGKSVDNLIDILLETGAYVDLDPQVRNVLPLLEGKGWARLEIFLLRFYDDVFTTKKVLEKMKEMNLRPGTYKELLALGIQYPTLQLEHPIVALGPNGYSTDGYFYQTNDAPCLDKAGYNHNLWIARKDLNWGPEARFIAVRK